MDQHCLSAASSWLDGAYPGSVTSRSVSLTGMASGVGRTVALISAGSVAFWGGVLFSETGALFLGLGASGLLSWSRDTGLSAVLIPGGCCGGALFLEMRALSLALGALFLALISLVELPRWPLGFGDNKLSPGPVIELVVTTLFSAFILGCNAIFLAIGVPSWSVDDLFCAGVPWLPVVPRTDVMSD